MTILMELEGVKMKKSRRLRPWVKYLLFSLLGAFIGISIYQLFTLRTIHKTPVGSYECRGGLIQVCSGDKRVAAYLGV